MTFKELKWFLKLVPRSPKRAGLLMRIYFLWDEFFSAAGHSAFALLFFSLFAGIVPGFWPAWIFCGLDLLFLFALVPSLFMTARKSKFQVDSLETTPVFEGETATVYVQLTALTKLDCVSVCCYRIEGDLKGEESQAVAVAADGSVRLCCKVKTEGRGCFMVSKVGVVIPEIMGMLRYVGKAGTLELLVYPRPMPLTSFAFLTYGASGLVFAPLLMPGINRGMDFSGVREYREGDALRDLHHKAFARYGKPFTKEFESERGAGAILLLDVSADSLAEKFLLEPLIRLAAGVGMWFMERGILGRFFIGNEEISLNAQDGGKSFLEALARIPRASLYERGTSRQLKMLRRLGTSRSFEWTPAARPMGPVLRLGLHEAEDSQVHKQVVVCRGTQQELVSDSVLKVGYELLGSRPISLEGMSR